MCLALACLAVLHVMLHQARVRPARLGETCGCEQYPFLEDSVFQETVTTSVEQPLAHVCCCGSE
jgi:hypothetical protein